MISEDFIAKHFERMTLKQFFKFLKNQVGVVAIKVQPTKANIYEVRAFPRREVMTIKELSEFFGMSPRHIHRLIKEKALPVYKVVLAWKEAGVIKNQLIFSYDDVKTWVSRPFFIKTRSRRKKK